MNAGWKKFKLITVTLALVGLSIGSVTHAQLNLPIPKPRDQQPKEHLRVVLRPLKEEFAFGQPIDLRLRMRNIRKEPLAIIRPSVGDDLKGWVLSAEITAPDGTKRVVISARRTAKLPDPESRDILRLKPGKEVDLEIRFASRVDRERSAEPWDAWNLGYDPSREGILEKCFPEPGEYKIVVSVDRYMEFIVVKREGQEEEVGAWRGKLSSNEVRVRVTRGKL